MKQTSKNSSVIIVSIICATVLILGIAIILFLYVRDNKSSEPEEYDDDFTTEEIVKPNTQNKLYPGDTTNPDSRFHSFDWLSERKLDISDLSGLSAGDLRLLRNAIFAKHGYIFSSDDLTKYFSNFQWYKPTSKNVTKLLSSVEQTNINLISKYEGKGSVKTSATAKLSSISYTGDYSDIVCHTYLSASDIYGLSKEQIRILRNTIYARHGRKFKKADLKNYFNQFSWYNGYRDEINMSELSAIEKHNINLLQKYE